MQREFSTPSAPPKIATMMVFCRICAQIDPEFVRLIPGATALDKLTFLQERCSTDPTGSDSNISYDVAEEDTFVLICKSPKIAVSIEDVIERMVRMNVGIKSGRSTSTSDSFIQGTSGDESSTSFGGNNLKTNQESTSKRQSQSLTDTTDDSNNIDEDTDVYEFDDTDDKFETPIGKPRNKKIKSDVTIKAKKPLNVKYIEYRKITSDEYREEDGKMHCKRCDYFAPTRKRIIEHIRRKHDIPQFECQHCDKKFKTRSDYNKHQKSHPEAETSTQFLVKNRRPDLCCKKCNKTFASLREWATHRESVHKIPTDISQYEKNARKGYRESGGKYCCNQCIFETEKKRYMTAHIQRQHDMVYECPYCDKRFSMRGTCNAHISIHLFCDMCGKLMHTKGELSIHIELEHGKSDSASTSSDQDESQSMLWGIMKLYEEKSGVFVCNICGHTLTESKKIEAHLQRNHKNSTFTCSVCKEMFSSLPEFNDHMSSHIRDESVPPKIEAFTCQHCGKAYNSKTTLKIHMEQVHKGEGEAASNSDSQEQQVEGGKQPLKCPHCAYVGHLTKYLNEHILRRHGEKKHQCPYCPKMFSTKSVFNVHKLRHIRSGILTKNNGMETKAKIFNCPICQKEFSTNLTLHKHLEQTHPDFDASGSELKNEVRDAEVFPCKLCGKVYASAVKLRHHVSQNHKGEENTVEGDDVGGMAKELKCPYCDYVGTVIRNFNDHIVRRHGEKKHHCPHCPKKFSTRSVYNSHVRTHPPGDAILPSESEERKVFTCPICSKAYQNEVSSEIT